MITESTIIIGNQDNRIQLVRGCPCLREYGNERICINNDDIMHIKSIAIDPHFFAQLASVEDLKGFESEKEDLCYGLLNLDPRDGKAYCVSQGKAVMINSHYIQAADIRDALNFVAPSEMGNDDVICSSCLYKYLVTLTDVFENLMNDIEKGQVILTYTRDLVNRMAYELSQGAIAYHHNSMDMNVEGLHSKIQSLAERHYEIVSKIRSPDEGELLKLLDAYRKLQKLESIFLHQVLSLNQEGEQGSALTYLRLMIGTTRKILILHNELRDLNITVLSEGEITPVQEEIVKRTEALRRESENNFRRLIPLLSEIESRPQEKGL